MGLSWLDKNPLCWVGQHGHVRFDQCALIRGCVGGQALGGLSGRVGAWVGARGVQQGLSASAAPQSERGGLKRCCVGLPCMVDGTPSFVRVHEHEGIEIGL